MDEDVTPEVEEKVLKPEEIKVYWENAFNVQFTALSMILLAFFIMLNAMAVQDDRRQRAAIGSLLGSFGVLPEGVGLDETGAYVASVDHISMRKEVVLFAAFEAFLDDQDWKTGDVLVFVDDEGRRRIRLADRFLFQKGSVRFHPRVFPLLDRLAAMLRALGRPVEIEGHTDAARGNSSNWILSARRATSVIRYLEEASGLDPQTLTAVGYGATRPAYPGRDARNRRVEIVVD